MTWSRRRSRGRSTTGRTHTDGLDAYGSGDYATALRVWRRLAEQGNAEAQNGCGVLCEHGQGVPTNYLQAVKWFLLAAKQGHATAQYNLGNMFDTGRGVRQNYVSAVEWYRLAAEQGLAEAQNSLGTMYGTGQGVLPDYMQAHLWFNLAASRFPPGEDHDKAARNRHRIAEHMTSDQVAKAQKLAREWKPRNEQTDPLCRRAGQAETRTA